MQTVVKCIANCVYDGLEAFNSNNKKKNKFILKSTMKIHKLSISIKISIEMSFFSKRRIFCKAYQQ